MLSLQSADGDPPFQPGDLFNRTPFRGFLEVTFDVGTGSGGVGTAVHQNTAVLARAERIRSVELEPVIHVDGDLAGGHRQGPGVGGWTQ